MQRKDPQVLSSWLPTFRDSPRPGVQESLGLPDRNENPAAQPGVSHPAQGA